MSRIGWNINCKMVADVAYLLKHVENLQPTALLLMDDNRNEFSITKAIHNLAPQAILIERFSDQHENDVWMQGAYAARDLINAWHNSDMLFNTPYVFHEILTEPKFNDSNVSQFVDWLDYAADYARSQNVHLCFPAFATASYSDGQLAGSKFDKMLRALDRHRGWHLLSCHEYGSVCLPLNVNTPGEWLLEPTRVQPERWKDVKIPTTRVDGRYPDLYTIMRLQWFNLRCSELGLQPLPIVVTEFSWDDIPALHSVRKADGSTIDVIKSLAAIYGVSSGFIDINGINTLTRVWSAFYPSLTPAQVAIKQLSWALETYPPNVIGMCLFTWSSNPQWRSYDFSGLTDFHNQLVALQSNTSHEDNPPMPTIISGSAQRFEKGTIVWRSNDGFIYALLNTGSAIQYPLTLYNNKPENTENAQTGYYKPMFAIGKVWAAFQRPIGKAVSQEFSCSFTAQANGDTLVTFSDGKQAMVSGVTWKDPAIVVPPAPSPVEDRPLWVITQADKMVILDFLSKLKTYIESL